VLIELKYPASTVVWPSIFRRTIFNFDSRFDVDLFRIFHALVLAAVGAHPHEWWPAQPSKDPVIDR